MPRHLSMLQPLAYLTVLDGKGTSAADTARLEERARIARELHDGVSQTLYAISLAAARARSLCEQNRSNEVQHLIDGVLQLADGGQSELRATLTNLRSDWLTSGGLVSAVETLTAGVRARSGLDIHVSLADEPDVPPISKEALLMIIREALHNIERHAGASRVDIALETNGHEVVLLITDNGRGFDPGQPRSGHFGLLSMRERAAAIGATLELFSADNLGTQIRVVLEAGEQ